MLSTPYYTSSPSSFSIFTTRIAYYCDGVAKDGKLYVQPVYVFSAEINNSGESEQIKVFVDVASQA